MTTTPEVRPRGDTLAALRCSLALLVRQPAARALLVACAAGPWLFATLLALTPATPTDTLLGRWVHESATAVPLVVLTFASQWVLPVVGAVAGGAVFGTPYRHRFWEALLTRGAGRGPVLAGAGLAAGLATAGAVLVLGASSLLAGLPAGDRHLVGLDGSTLGPAAATRLVVAAWCLAVPATLVPAALAALLAVTTRSLTAAVGGPVLLGLAAQVTTLVELPAPVRRLLPTAGWSTWHALATAGPAWGPAWRGVVVSLAWTTVLAVATAAVFARQDLT